MSEKNINSNENEISLKFIPKWTKLQSLNSRITTIPFLIYRLILNVSLKIVFFFFLKKVLYNQKTNERYFIAMYHINCALCLIVLCVDDFFVKFAEIHKKRLYFSVV